MPAHTVVNSFPTLARLHPDCKHAKDILARDVARARKVIAGVQPHGPRAFHEAARKRHHHHSTEPSQPTQPSGGSGGSDGELSIDVTDSGSSLVWGANACCADDYGF